ncbi:hypothetical protein [Paraburkholderia pallida]|uniref:TniB protein n=1 Tax=Paraburkholderia pallida TaxID=2547399 RepID=A0A4P7D6B2_9BURK|nr:hypothetical protein [Paraburkholderia pallida]QBR02510.1 hypothetical protein E1956_35305 [Paraburkholderia pallida]
MRDISTLLDSSFCLEQGDREILAHVRYDWRSGHRNYKQALGELNARTLLPFGRTPITIIGPTGVGKTCVMKDQDALLVSQSIKEGIPVRGSGYSPLGAPVAGKMDVSTIYSDIVRHALEPLVGYKIAYPPAKEGAPEARLSRTVAQTRAANLQVIEKMANSGHYKALFLDDAGPSATLLKANRALEAPTVFKEICDRARKCTVVLSGGPEIYSFLRQNDQQSARFKIIWMPPYYLRETEDVEEFKSFLRTLEEKKLGKRLIVPGTLTDHSFEVMAFCYGTVGMTVDMVISCTILARMEERALDWKLLREHLENNANHCGEMMALGQRFFDAARERRMDEYQMLFSFFAKREKEGHDVRKVPSPSDQKATAGEAGSAEPKGKNSPKGRNRSKAKPTRETM